MGQINSIFVVDMNKLQVQYNTTLVPENYGVISTLRPIDMQRYVNANTNVANADPERRFSEVVTNNSLVDDSIDLTGNTTKEISISGGAYWRDSSDPLIWGKKAFSKLYGFTSDAGIEHYRYWMNGDYTNLLYGEGSFAQDAVTFSLADATVTSDLDKCIDKFRWDPEYTRVARTEKGTKDIHLCEPLDYTIEEYDFELAGYNTKYNYAFMCDVFDTPDTYCINNIDASGIEAKNIVVEWYMDKLLYLSYKYWDLPTNQEDSVITKTEHPWDSSVDKANSSIMNAINTLYGADNLRRNGVTPPWNSVPISGDDYALRETGNVIWYRDNQKSKFTFDLYGDTDIEERRRKWSYVDVFDHIASYGTRNHVSNTGSQTNNWYGTSTNEYDNTDDTNIYAVGDESHLKYHTSEGGVVNATSPYRQIKSVIGYNYGEHSIQYGIGPAGISGAPIPIVGFYLNGYNHYTIDRNLHDSTETLFAHIHPFELDVSFDYYIRDNYDVDNKDENGNILDEENKHRQPLYNSDDGRRNDIWVDEYDMHHLRQIIDAYPGYAYEENLPTYVRNNDYDGRKKYKITYFDNIDQLGGDITKYIRTAVNNIEDNLISVSKYHSEDSNIVRRLAVIDRQPAYSGKHYTTNTDDCTVTRLDIDINVNSEYQSWQQITDVGFIKEGTATFEYSDDIFKLTDTDDAFNLMPTNNAVYPNEESTIRKNLYYRTHYVKHGNSYITADKFADTYHVESEPEEGFTLDRSKFPGVNVPIHVLHIDNVEYAIPDTSYHRSIVHKPDDAFCNDASHYIEHEGTYYGIPSESYTYDAEHDQYIKDKIFTSGKGHYAKVIGDIHIELTISYHTELEYIEDPEFSYESEHYVFVDSRYVRIPSITYSREMVIDDARTPQEGHYVLYEDNYYPAENYTDTYYEVIWYKRIIESVDNTYISYQGNYYVNGVDMSNRVRWRNVSDNDKDIINLCTRKSYTDATDDHLGGNYYVITGYRDVRKYYCSYIHTVTDNPTIISPTVDDVRIATELLDSTPYRSDIMFMIANSDTVWDIRSNLAANNIDVLYDDIVYRINELQHIYAPTATGFEYTYTSTHANETWYVDWQDINKDSDDKNFGIRDNTYTEGIFYLPSFPRRFDDTSTWNVKLNGKGGEEPATRYHYYRSLTIHYTRYRYYFVHFNTEISCFYSTVHTIIAPWVKYDYMYCNPKYVNQYNEWSLSDGYYQAPNEVIKLTDDGEGRRVYANLQETYSYGTRNWVANIPVYIKKLSLAVHVHEDENTEYPKMVDKYSKEMDKYSLVMNDYREYLEPGNVIVPNAISKVYGQDLGSRVYSVKGKLKQGLSIYLPKAYLLVKEQVMPLVAISPAVSGLVNQNVARTTDNHTATTLKQSTTVGTMINDNMLYDTIQMTVTVDGRVAKRCDLQNERYYPTDRILVLENDASLITVTYKSQTYGESETITINNSALGTDISNYIVDNKLMYFVRNINM